MGKNVIVIGADLSSFVHIDNTYKDIFRKYNQKGEIKPTLIDLHVYNRCHVIDVCNKCHDLLMMSMKVVIVLF